MITPLLLSLHLLAPEPAALTSRLHLLASPSAAVGADLASTPAGGTAMFLSPTPGRRAEAIAAEMGAGMGIVLANDAVMAATDYALLIGGAALAYISQSNGVLYGLAAAVILYNLIDIVALPVLLSTAELSVSDALTGLSSRRWAGVVAAGALEVLLDGIGAAVAVNRLNASGSLSAAGLVVPLLVFESIRMVTLPAATSVGLMLGESPGARESANGTTLPAPAPESKGLSGGAPSHALMLPLFAVHFG